MIPFQEKDDFLLLYGKNPRAHADFPTFVPKIYSSYKSDLHLDFEFKHKELAILKVKQ
jgi:hypothetical protein